MPAGVREARRSDRFNHPHEELESLLRLKSPFRVPIEGIQVAYQLQTLRQSKDERMTQRVLEDPSEETETEEDLLLARQLHVVGGKNDVLHHPCESNLLLTELTQPLHRTDHSRLRDFPYFHGINRQPILVPE